MFVNIEAKTSKKFVPKAIKCPSCTEPNLRLKWHGKNAQGLNDYWDLDTDSLHLCKTKYLKNLKTCNRCNKPNLRFKKIQGTYKLFEHTGKIHECDFSFLYKPISKKEQERIDAARKYYNYFYRNT